MAINKLTGEEVKQRINNWKNDPEANVQFHKMKCLGRGRWKVWYQDNGNKDSMILPSKSEAERFQKEFGSRNNLTVATPPEYMTLGEWSSVDLQKDGHLISKVKLDGDLRHINKVEEFTFPISCGTTAPIQDQKKKTTKQQGVTFKKINVYRETVTVTITFPKPINFDNLRDKIMSDPRLRNMEWTIRALNTVHHKTKDHIVWKRQKAGDGTSRMVLRFDKMNDIDWKYLPYPEILENADGLADSECQLVPLPGTKKDKYYCVGKISK